MTEKTVAPERIWLWCDERGFGSDFALTKTADSDVEYIRADLVTAPPAVCVKCGEPLGTPTQERVTRYCKSDNDSYCEFPAPPADDLSKFLIIEPHADGSVYIVNPDPLLRDPVNGMDAVIAKCSSVEEARQEARRLTSIAQCHIPSDQQEHPLQIFDAGFGSSQGDEANGTVPAPVDIPKVSSESAAEAERIKELENALGGMVAAFDGDGYGDKSVVATTRWCALSVAIKTLGWDRKSVTRNPPQSQSGGNEP